MSDVFQRTGRGGAGNYYSQKDIEEAEKAQRANDPEAQKTTNSPPPPAAPAAAEAPAPAPQYVRIGRGGAGNWTDSPTTADAQHRQHAADHTTAAVSAAAAAGRSRAGLTGRGGAGNWTGGGGGGDNNAESLEEEKAEQQRIAARIRQDIDASLPAPPKTYHQHDRDMEK